MCPRTITRVVGKGGTFTGTGGANDGGDFFDSYSCGLPPLRSWRYGGVIRLSVGIEQAQDLRLDLARALDFAGRSQRPGLEMLDVG